MSKPEATVSRWAKIGLVIMAAVLVLNLISFIWFPFLPWFEEREAGQEVVEQTYDAESAIDNYEWFRNQYHEIQAQRAQLENSWSELDRFYDTYGEDPDGWTRDVREEHSRIQKRITGNQQILEDLVAEYNARSDMANRELFKCGLPYSVDERFALRGPPGSGEADEPIDTDPNGNTVNTDATVPDPSQCDGLPDEIQQAAQQSG